MRMPPQTLFRKSDASRSIAVFANRRHLVSGGLKLIGSLMYRARFLVATYCGWRQTLLQFPKLMQGCGDPSQNPRDPRVLALSCWARSHYASICVRDETKVTNFLLCRAGSVRNWSIDVAACIMNQTSTAILPTTKYGKFEINLGIISKKKHRSLEMSSRIKDPPSFSSC